MSFPMTSYPPRGGQRPTGSRDTGPVFAVGRQAFVDGSGTRDHRVPLIDEKSTTVLGSLPDGAEVEILAWVPRGSATRYHVRSIQEHLVGWLGAKNLRRSLRRLSPEAQTRTSAAAVWIRPQMPNQSDPTPSVPGTASKPSKSRGTKTVKAKKPATARKRAR